MAIFKRRSVAAVVCAVVCLAALFISGRSGLSSVRARAETVFYTGEKGDGLCIYGDMNTRLDCAYNIGVVARRADSSLASLSIMDDAYDSLKRELESKSSIAKMAAANKKLGEAVESLYRDVKALGLSDTDDGLVTKQYRSFLSAADTISYDPYNGLAREFNSANSGFPAKIFGVPELEYF